MKPTCVGCQYDLSGIPGSLATGWCCPECGMINQVGGGGQGAPFSVRALTAVGLVVFNVVAVGILVWLRHNVDFINMMAVGCLLAMVEGIAWHFTFPPRNLRALKVFRWLIVGVLLGLATVCGLVVATILLFFALLLMGGGAIA